MSLRELVEAIADSLEPIRAEIPDLQISPVRLVNPTPPAIDMYQADPSQQADTYGTGNRQAFWTIRARVNTADVDDSQWLLLDLADPSSPASVHAALAADGSFAGTCQDSVVEGPSGQQFYADPGGQQQTLLGCEWRLQTIL